MASVEDKKDLYRRFVDEVWNKRNVDALEQFVAPDLIEHNPFPRYAPNLAGLKQALTDFLAAYPDLANIVEDLIAEGDKVVARTTWTGTHTGEWMGAKGTGRRVVVNGVQIVRVKDGKFVEHWGATMTTWG